MGLKYYIIDGYATRGEIISFPELKLEDFVIKLVFLLKHLQYVDLTQ